MPTIRDIARKAQVSVGTVSNYLNNPEIVAEGTREAIRQAVQELNYHPHAAARSLKSGLTHRIGIVPLISLQDNHSMDPGDTAFLDFLSAVNTAAAENGYDVLLSAATSSRHEMRIYERLMGEMQVDGIIMMGVRAEDPRISLLCKHHFPFITFGRTAEHQEHAYVDVDGQRGIELAVHHLAGLGHSRIAYLQPPKGLMLTKQRWQGYTQAMMEDGLKIDPSYVVPCSFREVDGAEAMEGLLTLPVPPTGLIAPNDITAFGAMHALQRHGLKAGVDVSVVGFDDIKLSAHWQPPLTTIAQPFRKIGFEVVSALIGVITGKEARPQIQIEPTLVVRQSTGPAAK